MLTPPPPQPKSSQPPPHRPPPRPTNTPKKTQTAEKPKIQRSGAGGKNHPPPKNPNTGRVVGRGGVAGRGRAGVEVRFWGWVGGFGEWAEACKKWDPKNPPTVGRGGAAGGDPTKPKKKNTHQKTKHKVLCPPPTGGLGVWGGAFGWLCLGSPKNPHPPHSPMPRWPFPVGRVAGGVAGGAFPNKKTGGWGGGGWAWGVHGG